MEERRAHVCVRGPSVHWLIVRELRRMHTVHRRMRESVRERVSKSLTGAEGVIRGVCHVSCLGMVRRSELMLWTMQIA